mmetsp:Transcript_33873/g.74342  ORF Transcript_33873/g.74342 Transcript_33873/m.74342 type:complete len:84 (+) Transcript_33873:213-464(+)
MAEDASSAPLTNISWEDKAWLQAFPLNQTTVLDYFSHSQVPFTCYPASAFHSCQITCELCFFSAVLRQDVHQRASKNAARTDR